MVSGTTASKAHKSIRLPKATLSMLRARATRSGESVNSLIERYVYEGLRGDEHPLITFRDGAAGRRPALAGTRLDVHQVVAAVRARRGSVAKAAADLSVADHKVEACLRYYAEFTDEVDAWQRYVDEAAQREEELHRRQQRVL